MPVCMLPQPAARRRPRPTHPCHPLCRLAPPHCRPTCFGLYFDVAAGTLNLEVILPAASPGEGARCIAAAAAAGPGVRVPTTTPAATHRRSSCLRHTASPAAAISSFTAQAALGGQAIAPTPPLWTGDTQRRVNITFPAAAFVGRPDGAYTFSAAAINADGSSEACNRPRTFNIT